MRLPRPSHDISRLSIASRILRHSFWVMTPRFRRPSFVAAQHKTLVVTIAGHDFYA